MYGSARLRTFYGQGDYSRALGYATGAYPRGGFFGKLKKVAKKVAAPAAKLATSSLGKTALSFLPGGSALSAGLGIAQGAGLFNQAKATNVLKAQAGGWSDAGTALRTKPPPVKASIGSGIATAVELVRALPGPRTGTPTNVLGELSKKMGFPFVSKEAIEAPNKKKKRKKTSKKTRRASSRRRSSRRSTKKRRKSSYARGDYGDNWVGNRPSRAKGTGQFLTRAGGRRRRKRGRGRRRGQRVTFTTKTGRRVSFTAR